MTELAWKPGIELAREAAAAGLRYIPSVDYTRGQGSVNPYPRGPNGRKLCRWCGKEVTNARRSYCDDRCREEFDIRMTSGYVRSLVERRDREVCARCGLDCRALDDAIYELQQTFNEAQEARGERYVYGVSTLLGRWLRANKLIGTAAWEAHHKAAVVEGGGCCGLEGYETLCWRCHGSETGRLRRRLARRSDERKRMA